MVRFAIILTGNGYQWNRRRAVSASAGAVLRRIIVEGEFGQTHHAMLRTLFASLGAEPSKTWSVGDNLEWDVGAPQTFGAYGIWVDVRRDGLPEGAPVRPDRIVHSIRDLI
jgi:putative hydrolase of the HAD superfamily